MKEVRTKQAPEPIGPYSQAIEEGGFVFLSGQIAINYRDNSFDPNLNASDQTKIVMENLKAILKSRNLDFGDVVKTEIFLADINDFEEINNVYRGYFNKKPYPARSTVEVSGLPKGARVEIAMIARMKNGNN